MALLEEAGEQIMEILTKHGKTLDGHTERLQNIESKVQQIGEQMETVAEFAKAVNEVVTAQKQINEIMANGFVEINKKFTEHTRILDALRNDVKDIKQNR